MRQAAAEAIGQIGTLDARALPRLTAGLRSPDNLVRIDGRAWELDQGFLAGKRVTIVRRWLTPEVPPAGAALTRLRLYATPYIHYTVRRERPEVIHLTEQFEFSAAHRLHCPALSGEENHRLFGKCNNPRGHGHNYVVEVTVAGPADAPAGLSCPREPFELAVKQHVIDRFDHKHLNEDTDEFRDLTPTVENIARVVWGLLADHVAPARLVRVRVYETPKTWADYRGPG